MKASVVIPAFNAEKTIRQCLVSLQKQTISPRDFEVLVIDDGSTDQTAKIVSEFKNVKLSAQKNAGPAVGRNRGAQKAQGELVVFLDSDCVPKKNWLFEMLKPFDDPTVTGVQGQYENGVNHWVAEFVQLEIEERYERMKKSMAEHGRIDFVSTYSAGYRKKVFLENGGFDESFRTASGEDTDLSFRLADKGFKLVFAPNAVVRHFHPTSLVKYFKTKFFRAYWRARLYKKNPGKIAGDSYTNPLIKLQILTVGFAFVYLSMGILNYFLKIPILSGSLGVLPWSILLLLIFSAPPSFFIFKKNIFLGILALFIIFPVNAFLFGFGILYGTLKMGNSR